MTSTAAEPQMPPTGAADVPTVDALLLGRRIRSLRIARGMTLEQLGAAIDRAPSQVSTIENGKREPRLSMLRRIASALGTTTDNLLVDEVPNERAGLEIAVERAQRGAVFSALGIGPIRVSKAHSDETLRTILALHAEVERLHRERAATPEEARRANASLRATMRARDNYFPELEAQAKELLVAVGHTGGPVSQQLVSDMANHLGFTLHYVGDLPHSTRSVTDSRNGRIYLPTQQSASRDSRSPVVQAFASSVLGHSEPTSYADFLRQRVETNYLTAAILLPESDAVRFLTEAKNFRRISLEDLRDAFAVSYETAAHRFTNLATARLGIPVHFTKVHESGTIVKAYSNDGVKHPTDALGAVEGTTVCRKWTAFTVFAAEDRFSPWYQYTDNPNGTYWCTSRIEKAKEGEYSITVGVPFEHVKWFRGRETSNRSQSSCPDESCCKSAPSDLADKWAHQSWPAARTPTSLLAALPTGTFPGVDQVEVYRFLEAHAPV
ncbi:putative transcriptional regulator/DNA-binding XRE family transcriptional regulator [Okibacterium sp. HSC-33S16]|uniref:helix-turn-helix transcriptional regulator n=1 Tax=Okibacterium sp. HSC-33S16 TaxID=2910965 RepID=UPI0020A15E58|nr:helix-turn-helix transcriptional regulator [Okibacterium sp. HSC-33S16]MCP2032333.1 putative transcriptional regulator/DNA-binding XRE family transcriptional regulator [Okibacterium sp. HSC-33S16]